MDPFLSKPTSSRIQSYKHHGKDSDELRRRRNQYNVSLRKVLINLDNTNKTYDLDRILE